MSRRLDRHELVAVNAVLRAELCRLRRETDRLRVENEILHEAAQPLIHQAPAHERFTFIHRLRDRFAVKRLCRLLVTDRGNYYLWARAEVRRQTQAARERELLELIVETHAAYPAYGAERNTRELKRQGVQVGRRRVARLMREHGIAGITRRKRRNLTKPDQGAAVVPDLVRREFTCCPPARGREFTDGDGWRGWDRLCRPSRPRSSPLLFRG